VEPFFPSPHPTLGRFTFLSAVIYTLISLNLSKVSAKDRSARDFSCRNVHSSRTAAADQRRTASGPVWRPRADGRSSPGAGPKGASEFP